MVQLSEDDMTQGHRYALCVGIETYTELPNRHLRYAVADANAIAERLGDPARGNFAVTCLTEPDQTTKYALDKILDQMLNAENLNPDDLVVIYISCHGYVYGKSNIFYLLPSDAKMASDDLPKKQTVIDIYDLSKTLSAAKVKNIIFLLDVCHSGGAGDVLKHLDLSLDPDTNLFIIGAARHDQKAMQSSQLRHGVFTSYLLQAFEEKPHRSDGWITIAEIHSFVSEKINKSKASVSPKTDSPVQIQARSALVNPNLPFTKNPRYSPSSREFHEDVKKLLELIQYEPLQTAIPEEAPPGFYVAEIKAGVDTLQVGIISYYNQVEPLMPRDAEKIALFMKEQVEHGNLDVGLLVTDLEVSNEMKHTLQQDGARYLKIRTYEGIRKHLIDFNKYIQKLVEEYQNPAPERRDDPPLAQVYIPLHAERCRYEANLSPADLIEMKSTDKLRKGYQVTWKGDLESEVKRWISDPAAPRLALLADYGCGKTTFCQHLAATLAKNYLTAEEHARHQQRIPLLIPLRNFSKNPVDFEGYLVAYLKQYCRVYNADAQALMKMAEAGLLLFLLDGFDEMASRATYDTVRLNIELFEQLANLPYNKVILTTRPEYFLDLHQERQVLQAYNDCLYHLQPFNEEQIDLYLQKRVPFLKPQKSEPRKNWTYYRQQINKIHDLSDLVRRPVLLEMVIKTLPILVEEGEIVNRPNLYQRYLEGELDRQHLKKQRDLLIDRKKRFEIMEQIALELFRTDKVELASKRILEVSKELLTLEQQEEMEGSLREIVTCSFLIRISNEYRFSHQSFLEYLVAGRLAKDIMEREPKTLRMKPLTRTILDFLLEFEAGVVQKSSTVASASNTTVSFDQKRLESWFRANPKDRWLSGNTVSLLARLLPSDRMHQLPLSKADLSEANLSEANLSGANLSGANLSEANLNGANLSGANLSGANLNGANLSFTDLQEADLQGASLREVDSQRAHLSGANLRKADLGMANLTGANLQGVNLQETNLVGATLKETILDYETIQCHVCNHANPPGSDFCDECGTAFT